MAAQVKIQNFVQALGRGLINWNADVFKVALSNTLPNAATVVTIADIVQIANGNGYVTNGTVIAATAYSQAAGTGKFVGNDVSFTAAGGNIGPFQYIIIWDSTANIVESYVDFGVAVTITNGNVFLVDFDGVNGIAQLA